VIDRPPRRSPIEIVERALLVLGIGVFGYLLHRIGLHTVWDNLRMIGWGYAVVIGQDIFAFIFNTRAWHWAFPPPRPPIAFRRLLAARMAGDAINAVTPTALVGGEIVRGRMLVGRADMPSVWASITIAKITQTLSQVVLMAGGLALVLADTPLPDGVRRGLFIFLGLLTVGLGLGVVMQRRGLFTAGAALLRRFGVRLPEGLVERLHHLDQQVVRFYAAPGPFLWSTTYFLVGWLMNVVETYLVMLFLGMESGWHLALTIEVLSLAIDAALFFVPGQVGVQEGGKVLIFSMLGLPPAKGLALALARRIRELTWALVGLVILAHHQAGRGAKDVVAVSRA
jgi:putative membrane protein